MSLRRPSSPVLSLLLLLIACRPVEPPGASAGFRTVELPAPILLRDFEASAPPGDCEPLPGPGPLRSLTPAGNGRMLALPASGVRVELLGAGLEWIASRDLEPVGSDHPSGLSRPLHRDPTEAWLLGDSVLAVVDGVGRSLVLHPGGMREGGEAVRVPLPFQPLRAVPLGRGLALVSPGPVGGRLVHLWEPGGELRGLEVMTPPLDDARLVVLVSALVPVELSRGEAAFLHPLLVPRGYRVDPDGAVSVFPLPVPDGQADRVGRVPRFPWREEELVDMLATALDATADPGGGILVLTRSGRWHEGFREKAVIRIDAGMRPVQAMRLPVNALRVVAMSGADHIAVEDQEGAWHRCAGFGALRTGESVPSNHGEWVDGRAE